MLQRRFNHFASVAGFAAVVTAFGMQGIAIAGTAQSFYGEAASVIASPALASNTTRAAVQASAAAAMRGGTLMFGEAAGLPQVQPAQSDVTRADVKQELLSETVAERKAMRQLYLD